MSQTATNNEEDLHSQHYTFKYRVVAWVSNHLSDQYTYRVRRGLLHALKRKGGLGWVPEVFSKSVATAEIESLRTLPLGIHGETMADKQQKVADTAQSVSGK